MKTRLILITSILVFFLKNSLAQADTSKTSFLSKLYFPFDFGYTLSEQKGILKRNFKNKHRNNQMV